MEHSTDKIIAEYIWLDGYGGLRSKIRVLKPSNYSVETIPIWNFDGSSTKQASTQNSVILRPVQLYRNPFHKPGYLVLCETYAQDEFGRMHAIASNERYQVLKYFHIADYVKPWYGINQQYYILDLEGKPFENFDDPQKSQYTHYCGTRGVKGRTFAEAHLKACLFAGLEISGINAEVGPSQWQYKIGPVEGIEAADQLWIARYIMQRLAEQTGVTISYHPKPLGDDFPGSSSHVTFSTIQMRLPDGYPAITNAIDKLAENHGTYVQNCGEYTAARLTGEHGASLFNNFSWGIGSRDTSIRIPMETFNNKCGYFEDRRPSANMDPYKICGLILETIC